MTEAPPISPAFDVGAVMRQVHFAFRKTPNGYQASHSTYGVDVSQGRVQLRAIAGAARRSASLTLNTRSVQRGARSLLRGPMNTEVRADGTLATRKGSVIEHLTNTARGVEQSWELATTPSGVGDLVVRVAVDGQRFRGASDRGLHFVDDTEGLGFRYGHATFVDAEGRRTDIASQWLDGSIVLRVPEVVLEGASYPAVLDPTAEPEFEMNEPISEPGALGVGAPQISWGYGMFLVVWEDFGWDADIVAARVLSDGTVLDPTGIQITSDDVRDDAHPDVVAVGSGWYVVWDTAVYEATGRDIYGARVNTAGTTWSMPISEAPGQQLYPAISTQNGPNILVVWEDHRTPTNGGDVYGARWTNDTVLDPSGIAISTAADDQREPDVAVTSGGDYFVAWEDHRGGADDDIYGARVSPTATTLDPSGIPISVAANTQENPAVVTDGVNFYVVWEDGRTNPNAPDIYGGRVSLAGAPLDGSGIAISSAAYEQRNPAVSRTAAGNVMVVWDDTRNAGSAIYAARITPAMTVLEPAGIAVTTGGIGVEAVTPSAAYNGSVVFVAWAGNDNGFAVWGARLSSTGTLLDTPRLLSPDVGDQLTPDVAFDGTNYLVAWEDYRNGSATSGDILGVRVSNTGTVLDASGIVIARAAGRQYAPQIAFDGTNYLVAWGDRRSVNDEDIYATRVSKSGTVLDGTSGFIVCPANANQSFPAVAFDGTNYLIVWVDSRTPANSTDIYGARVSPAASVLDGTGFPIAALAAAQSEPDLAFDGTNWLVVWSDERNGAVTGLDIYGSRVSPAGMVVDPTGIPMSTAPDSQSGPAIAPGAGGTSLVSWTDQRDSTVSGRDVYASRVDPSGVVLDSVGIVVSNEVQTQDASAVAFDGEDWLVTWHDDRSSSTNHRDVYANRITSGGSVRDGAGFPISANVVDETFPAVASDGTGRSVVVYQRPDTALSAAGRFIDNMDNDKPNGAPCSSNNACQSGFCVDGVCCASSCFGGSTTDCMACSVAAGAGTDGVCEVTMLPAICAVAPTWVKLFAPGGTTTTPTPTYKWERLPNATSYHLYVANEGLVPVNTVYAWTDLTCDATECQLTPNAPLVNGWAHFWVRPSNSAGDGLWGGGKAFTVNAPNGPIATLLSPSGTITTSTPVYSWTAVINATEYHLWVNDSAGVRVNQVVSAASAGCASGGTCSFTPSSSLYNGPALWWIRGQSAAGNGPWSAPKSFTVALALPGLVTLTAPNGAAGTTNPTYTWVADPASTQYYLWVNDSVANRVNVILDSSAVCSSGSCSYFPNKVLSSGNGRWWVQGRNAVGNGPWGPGTAFSAP